MDETVDKRSKNNKRPLRFPQFESTLTFFQVVFVSLWFWWKEVVVISIVTAFMMNWIIIRPLMWEKQRQREQQMQEDKARIITTQPVRN